METVITETKTQTNQSAALTYPGFLATALPLAKMGFLITALEPGGKRPILDNWPDTATTDIDQLKRWAEVYPDANPGVVCLPNGNCILDADVPGLAERYEKETGHLFPVTHSSKTRSNEDRYHYYFLQTSKSRALGNLTKKQTKLFDFQQNRKQCVGPGSYRKDLNGFYTVVNDEPPVSIPDELVDWLATFPRKEDIDSQARLATSASVPTEVVEDDGSPILEGGRDNWLTQQSGKMRRKGASYQEIVDRLSELNEARCIPPLPTSDIERIAKSVCRYKPAEVTVYLSGKPLDDPTIDLTVDIDESGDTEEIAKDWRSYFKKVSELEDGGVRMLISGFLPEGTIFIGSLPGHGKTFLGLSLAKALTTGKPMFGEFAVPKRYPVLYLIPESSGCAFKVRLQKFAIPDDEKLFLCRTLSEGMTLFLDDPVIQEVVEKMHPVVILDTAIRFSQAQDENSASQNQKLVNDMVRLRQMGAPAVVGFHHATKTSAKEAMSLENSLRGTGDFAAMCDATYAIRRDELLYDNGEGPIEIEVVCVKPRDFDPPLPFRLIAKYKTEDGRIISTIDTTGDFTVRDFQAEQYNLESSFVKAVTENPTYTLDDLAALLKTNRSAVDRLAKKLRYVKPRYGPWESRDAKPPSK